MLSEATRVEFKTTDSVLEALILEADLIKRHLPEYNTSSKDDKSFNYVVITDEDFPRVLTVRGKDLLESDDYKIKETFGPFPHGMELREALKIIRRIFPYRDRCTPFDSAQGKPPVACFNAQIGLCPGVCSGAINKSEYAKVVRSINLFFKGKKKEIIKGLTKHMKQAAKDKQFELAAEYRNKIFALTHINDIALIRRKNASPSTALGATRIMRVEGYDIAHISGTNTVGAMVVLEDGALAKHEYKRFKIMGNAKDRSDDTANLRELLERRFRHTEWRQPDLIVIDGSVAQRNVAEQVVGHRVTDIKIVNVVKNAQHKPERIVGDTKVVKDYHHDILLVNQEAHRFAINYHRLLRGKITK
jgi:excinuclease ABC subunit C